MTQEPEYEFDVAVTFAGEDREYVHEVVDAIKGDVEVFYDKDYEVEAWGEDGIEYFTNVYMNRARFAVIFVSASYAEKMWTKIERRSALARAATQRSAYVLPVRLDDTQLEGLLPTTIYLDARRLGLEGIVRAIKTKVARTPPEVRSPSELADDEGRVPRTQEEIEALMKSRQGLWEYKLYAGLLRVNMDKLEARYRDFAIGYARPIGRHVSVRELADLGIAETSSIAAITDSINQVLDAKVQERAFGAPGEPGDVDAIVHLASSFIAIYEDLLNWWARLRGTSTDIGAASEALAALTSYSVQPIQEMRRFVEDFMAEVDTAEERSAAGETVSIQQTVTFDLDPALPATYKEKMRAAIQDGA